MELKRLQSVEPDGSPDRPVRIVVADDERRIRLALRMCLEAEGYVVHEAADGRQALELIAGRAPDLLILDLAMPGFDGLQTLAALRDVGDVLPTPRVIVLTAYGSDVAAARAIGLGASAFLEKPLVPQVLRNAVRHVMEKCSPAAVGQPA